MKRQKIFNAVQSLALLAAVIALVLYPKESVGAAKDGVTLCLNVIVPSLFPFFVLSALIVDTGVTNGLSRVFERVMRPLFNVGGACVAAFALGFIGGYPVGAKTVIALYESGGCTKTEAERLLAFCNNSGPAFIFGVVGAGVFSSGKIGLLLYLAHTAASVIVGILFRFWKRDRRETRASAKSIPPAPPARRFVPAFTDAIKNSFQSTLNICGFVIFFTVFIKLMFISGAIPFLAALLGKLLSPLGFDEQWGERLLTGFIELSSGVWTLRGAASHLTGSVAMAAFMLGWAGVSVHFQVLSFIGESGLSVRTYIIGKMLQGLISAGLALALTHIGAFELPAAAYLADQVESIAGIGFLRALLYSCAGAVLLFAIFLRIARRHRRKKKPLRL